MEAKDVLGKVSNLETCLLLDWKKPTERCWLKEQDGTWVLVSHVRFFNIKSSESLRVSFVYHNGDRHQEEAKYYTVLPAPDFSEIWAELPKYIEFSSKETIYLELLKKQIHYSNTRGFTHSVIINGNIAQAAAELYLKLRSEKLLPL